MNLNRKMTLIFCSLVMGISLLFSFFTILIGKANLVKAYREKTLDIAEIVAKRVDGDAHDQLGNRADSYYDILTDDIRSFINGGTIQYIYTLKKVNNDEAAYMVDADEEDPAELGETCEMEDEMREAFNGKISANPYPVGDKWGKYYSAYAPIYNSNHEVVAIVGVDCSSAKVDKAVVGMIENCIILGMMIVVVSLVLVRVLAIKLTKNINKIYFMVDDIATSDGDLTERLEIHSGDEIELLGDSMNLFLDKLQNVISRIKKIGEVVYSHSNSIQESSIADKKSIELLYEDVEKIGNTEEKILASMKEVTVVIKNIVDSIQRMHLISENEMQKTVASSVKANKQKVNFMKIKEEATKNIVSIKQSLVERVEKLKAINEIGDFTKDIAGIAKQTQLLALNANIEAARAGEFGKGFAVVASEISVLASNSSETANQIERINQIVSEASEELVSCIHEMIQFIEKTVLVDYDEMVHISIDNDQTFNQFSVTMKNILENITSIHHNMAGIEKTIEEVTEALSQSALSMEGIAAASEQLNLNAAHINELIEASNKEINELQQQIGYFKIE